MVRRRRQTPQVIRRERRQFSRSPAQDPLDNIVIFLGRKGTGCIEDVSTRADGVGGGGKDRVLGGHVAFDTPFSPPRELLRVSEEVALG